MVARIGTLLDLDHLELFQHLKAMPALDEQDDIAGLQVPGSRDIAADRRRSPPADGHA